jgi:hypothetical protein
MHHATVLLAVACLAFAPAPVYRPKKAEPVSARIVALMARYRGDIPPAEGMGEQEGLTVKELEPYLMSHLAGVAVRMGVKTRAEYRSLLPYLRDPDCKLRFIAMHAIETATKAYPHGVSVGWFLDLESAGHREMAGRFAELIEQMDR